MELDDPDLPRRLLLSLGGSGEASSMSKGSVALYAILCVIFVCGSGLASGLTLGLMSLDKVEMQVLLRSGTAKEQRLAARILPIIADPHWLLVTLLLCNAACFEALPLFLDALINPVGAILISVTLILLFGEILPQAVCARHGLVIGANLSWLVRLFMWITVPISWPLARGLDWLLGKEDYDLFRRAELKALVDLHGADGGFGGKLTTDEVQIISGALDLTNKIAYSAMTPLDKAVMLSTDMCLDQPTIAMILASGHSRMPVYAGDCRTSIVGLVLVKELLAYAFRHTAPGGHDDGGDSLGVPISSLNIRQLPRMPANTRMYDLLKLFQTGRAHMVVLTQPDPNANNTNNNGAGAPAAAIPNAPSAPNMMLLTSAAAGERVARIGDHAKPATPTGTPTADAGIKSTLPDIATATTTNSAGSREDVAPAAKALAAEGLSTPFDKQSVALAAVEAAPELPTVDSSGPPVTKSESKKERKKEKKERKRQKRKEREEAIARASKHSILSKVSSGSSSSSSDSDDEEREPPQPQVPHLAPVGDPIGIITIEDVLEELLGQEILDETDQFADNEQTMPINDAARLEAAQKLPDRVRQLVLGSGVMAVARRHSRQVYTPRMSVGGHLVATHTGGGYLTGGAASGAATPGQQLSRHSGSQNKAYTVTSPSPVGPNSLTNTPVPGSSVSVIGPASGGLMKMLYHQAQTSAPGAAGVPPTFHKSTSLQRLHGHALPPLPNAGGSGTLAAHLASAGVPERSATPGPGVPAAGASAKAPHTALEIGPAPPAR